MVAKSNPIKSQIIFYPIIFTVFPFISLYARNFLLVPVYEVLAALLIVLVIMTLLWWVIFRITKSLQKSGLIVSVFFILFFSFGHFLTAIANLLLRTTGVDIRPLLFNNIRWKMIILLVLWVAIFILFIYLINKVDSPLRLITKFMNVTSIALLVMIIFQSTRESSELREIIHEGTTIDRGEPIFANEDPIIQINLPRIPLPDIYYIIVDGYGRADILEDYYEHDNSEFLGFLVEKGFYLPADSQSNYSHTVLSLASSLNLEYLDDLADRVGLNSNNPYPAVQLIHLNRLSDFLTNLGYITVAFETGFGGTELFNADYYLAPTYTLTAFQNELIKLTPMRILFQNYQYESQRQRIHNTFNNLPPLIQTDQPMFVFAHINAPHPPFVFKSNGEPNNPDMVYISTDGNSFTDISGRAAYADQYREQIIYLNQRIREVIEKINRSSGGNSIIILQADHGPGSMLIWNSKEETNILERMSILNAYYFPDQNYSKLYTGITPVNTFRIILDQYFGTQLGLIGDISYFSLMNKPYDFIDVTNEVSKDK